MIVAFLCMLGPELLRADAFSELFASAKASYIEGKYHASLDVLRRILNDKRIAEADRIAALDLMARCLSSTGQPRKAQEVFIKILLISERYDFTENEQLPERDFQAARARFNDRYGSEGSARRCMATSHVGLLLGVGSSRFRDDDLAQLKDVETTVGGSLRRTRELLWTLGGAYAFAATRRISVEGGIAWRRSGGAITALVPGQSPYTEKIEIHYLDLSAAARYPLATLRPVGLDMALGTALQVPILVRGQVTAGGATTSGTVSDYARSGSLRPFLAVGVLVSDVSEGGLRFELSYSPETFGHAFADARIRGDLDVSEVIMRVVFLF